MDAVSVPKMLVASNVNVPASISCKALMMRFPSVKAKRGSSKDTYIPVGIFNFTSGLGIPEMVQLMETWNPTVRFLEGRMGPTVNWGGSREMENRNTSELVWLQNDNELNHESIRKFLSDFQKKARNKSKCPVNLV